MEGKVHGVAAGSKALKGSCSLQIGANGSLNEAGGCGRGRQPLGFVSVMENDLGVDLSYLWV